MSKQTPAAVVLTVLVCALGQSAIAGEQVLEFKLVVKPIEVKSLGGAQRRWAGRSSE